MKLFALDGKVAYVPGGYGGIGEAIAWGLAQHGARVAISGRNLDKAQALAAQLRDAGHDAFGLAMDAHSVADARSSVDAVAQHFAALDILVNCVGIQREQKIDEVDEATFDEVLAVNLKAAMFLAQAAARHQHEGGKQVHLLSVRAQLGLRGRGYSAYCATKGALVMLIRQHAMELAPRGITVNAIRAGVTATPAAQKIPGYDKLEADARRRNPSGRMTSTDDVARAIAVLAHADTHWITGNVIGVDGGEDIVG
jgi:NAD(P)-dependent dehydrogenase (short-subunit alcohol dehydrogenase family)